jgi:4a-hydroxytetrahydrobiopterin dehydratase
VSRLLSDEERDRQLAQLTGWTGDASHLHRAFEFPAFLTGITVVDEVATVAEAMDHHPDIDIRWRTVHFTLATHSAGGVTQLDIELAHRIGSLAAEHGGR